MIRAVFICGILLTSGYVNAKPVKPTSTDAYQSVEFALTVLMSILNPSHFDIIAKEDLTALMEDITQYSHSLKESTVLPSNEKIVEKFNEIVMKNYKIAAEHAVNNPANGMTDPKYKKLQQGIKDAIVQTTQEALETADEMIIRKMTDPETYNSKALGKLADELLKIAKETKPVKLSKTIQDTKKDLDKLDSIKEDFDRMADELDKIED